MKATIKKLLPIMLVVMVLATVSVFGSLVSGAETIAEVPADAVSLFDTGVINGITNVRTVINPTTKVKLVGKGPNDNLEVRFGNNGTYDLYLNGFSMYNDKYVHL